MFLFEESWIPSRIKKLIKAISGIDPGIKNIEFNKEAVEELINKSKENITRKLKILKNQKRWQWIALRGEAGALFNTNNEFVKAMLAIGIAHNALCLHFYP